MIIKIILLIFLLVMSAYFSSAETAYTAVNRIQVELLADEENKQASNVLWILDHSHQMLSAILIGNNIVNISASALTTAMVIDYIGSNAIGLATGILTLVVLVFGEITPKSLASLYALRISLAYSTSIRFFIMLLTPLVFFVEGVKKCIYFVLHIDPESLNNTMTEDELITLVDKANEDGAIESDEFEMISNVFSLDDSYARDIMIPQPDITYISADADYEEFLEIYKDSYYTRYPVYSESKENIIGTINVKDILANPVGSEFNIRKLLREPHFSFEHKEVGTLLMEMRKESISIVFVLDEFGAVSGLITLEDILEEIVGEIHDEFDNNETSVISEIKPGKEYLIEGSVNLDEVNDALNMHLSSDQYDTIAGFMIERFDRLPKNGEVLVLDDGTKLCAAIVKKNRIEKIHLLRSANK